MKEGSGMFFSTGIVFDYDDEDFGEGSGDRLEATKIDTGIAMKVPTIITDYDYENSIKLEQKKKDQEVYIESPITKSNEIVEVVITSTEKSGRNKDTSTTNKIKNSDNVTKFATNIVKHEA